MSTVYVFTFDIMVLLLKTAVELVSNDLAKHLNDLAERLVLHVPQLPDFVAWWIVFIVYWTLFVSVVNFGFESIRRRFR